MTTTGVPGGPERVGGAGRDRAGTVPAAAGVARGRGARGAVAANRVDVTVSSRIAAGREGLRVDLGAGVAVCMSASLQRRKKMNIT